MESVRQTRSRKASLVPPAKESEPKDTKKPSSKKQKLTNGRSTSPSNENEVEIPTLDDMTSLLFANEAIEGDNVPQQKQKAKQPQLKQKTASKENETEENPSVSTRIGREKSDSSSTFNPSTSDEAKKELENLLKMANSLASSGDFAQAITFYNKAVTLNEKSGAAWIAMGHCYAMMGEDHKALASYEQALKRVPSSQKDEQLWYGVGSLYQKFEDWNNAEMSFRNALRLEPNNNLKGELLYNLGLVMKAKGDYADSIKCFNKAVVSGAFASDKIIEILGQITELYEELNDNEGTLKTLSYSLMVQENNPPVLMKAGWLCFQNDKIDQAITYLKKAEQLIPDDARIGYVIARCYLKQKQHTTAYEILHKCLTKDGTNPILWSSLGILFGELTQLKQCYDCLTKAVKGDPKCAEHFFNLGCLFELSSQMKDAIGMYDKALEINPAFQLAQQRKMNASAQLNSKMDLTLEVQFKHPPFSLIPEKKKTINSLLAPQKNSESSLLNAKSIGSGLLSGKLEGLKVGQENKSGDASSFKLPKPQSGESAKLPSAQSLAGMNGFSFLQNNYNSVNNFLINPMLPFNQEGENSAVSSLAPSRVMTDEITSFLKGGDLAKQLSGLSAILAKNNPSGNGNIQASSIQTVNIDSLKATKQTSSPIVLKHNPQVLSLGEAVKKNGIGELSKQNSKIELNVNKRGFKPSNEEDFEPQKKIKTDSVIKESIPTGNN